MTTFGGYDHENAARALSVQARALKMRGVLVVRDFVDPSTEQNRGEPVWLELPANDHASDRSTVQDEDDDDPPVRTFSHDGHLRVVALRAAHALGLCG